MNTNNYIKTVLDTLNFFFHFVLLLLLLLLLLFNVYLLLSLLFSCCYSSSIFYLYIRFFFLLHHHLLNVSKYLRVFFYGCWLCVFAIVIKIGGKSLIDAISSVLVVVCLFVCYISVKFNYISN